MRRWLGGRRRLAVAAGMCVVLLLVSALGAVAAGQDALQDLGVTGPVHADLPAAETGHPMAGVQRAGRVDVARRAAGLGARVSRALVTIASAGRLLTIPRSFLGISTEYWGLPMFERQPSVLERTLALLHVPGEGPLVLRIGGDSADHAFWAPKVRPLPTWAFELTPQWLRGTSALVRDLGLRVILDLNLVTESPLAASQWAQAAEAQLPSGSISAFEIGNEPDIYNRQLWLTTVAHSGIVPPIVLTARTYAHDFQAYARALRSVAPALPLIGPALANPSAHRGWIRMLLASRPAHVAEVSVHRYPYSACALPGTAAFATIGRVLSEHATAGVARSVAPAVAIARRAGVPVRVTELNSVTCGGRAGVSDAFATALWAPDALFELVRAGVTGVNIHVRARAVNAAFTMGPGGLDAKPLLYGLVAFARVLGPGAQLVPLRVSAGRAVHLKAWGVRVGGGGLHVLLIDKGGQPVNVSLRLPGVGEAIVERLLAPSPGARTGVTLAGQYLDVSGTWRGRLRWQAIRAGAAGYAVAVPRYSAALVTLRLRTGAFGGGGGGAGAGAAGARVEAGGGAGGGAGGRRGGGGRGRAPRAARLAGKAAGAGGGRARPPAGGGAGAGKNPPAPSVDRRMPQRLMPRRLLPGTLPPGTLPPRTLPPRTLPPRTLLPGTLLPGTVLPLPRPRKIGGAAAVHLTMTPREAKSRVHGRALNRSYPRLRSDYESAVRCRADRADSTCSPFYA